MRRLLVAGADLDTRSEVSDRQRTVNDALCGGHLELGELRDGAVVEISGISGKTGLLRDKTEVKNILVHTEDVQPVRTGSRVGECHVANGLLSDHRNVPLRTSTSAAEDHRVASSNIPRPDQPAFRAWA
jgi:hypothetical protein